MENIGDHIKGLILAGGKGTRLRPLTYTDAKQLIPIANKPILHYVIDDLKNAGITDIGVIVGHTEERIKLIKDTLGDGSNLGVKISYIEQDAPRGIAHAIGLGEGFVGDEPFCAYLGDNILKGGIKEYVDKFNESDCDAGILLAKHKNPSRFGVAIFKDEKLVGLVEKPQKPPSEFVISGIYLFRKPVFDVIRVLKPSWRNELEITHAADKMIKSKEYSVMYSTINGWWKDTGKPEDILEANQLVLEELSLSNEGKVEEGATLQGRVGIGKGSVVKKGSLIRGPSIIGKGCEIGPDVYIGPYTSIGDNSIIRGCEIESSVVMNNVRIECDKRISDSLIGRDVTIVSSKDTKPKTCKFVLGETSFVCV